MKTSNETRTVVASTGFTLALPSIVANIKPKFVVDLPQKHTATIYETTAQKRVAGDKSETVPAYRLIVLNSKGRKSGKVRSFGCRTYGDGVFLTDDDGLLDLKFALEGAANELTPKTTRSTAHFEIDEDD